MTKKQDQENPKSKTTQFLSNACKVVGLVFTIIKGIDLLQKLMARNNQPSNQEKLDAKLKFEEDKAHLAENHLREMLKIRQEFSQQQPEKPEPKPFQPLRPKLYDPGKPMEDFQSIRLFASAIHKGGKCSVIAPKGIGKTALFMQISSAAASGTSTGLWPSYDEGEHAPQRVLYYDGELTDQDMYNRYYKYGYEFPANFERYDRTQFRTANTLLTDLKWKVENELAEGSEAMTVIDNITKILKTEQVSEVNKFNKDLDEIYALAQNRGIRLTLISIIHVLKEYTPGTPLELKDAAGGSNLTNFDDAVIGIEQPKTGGKDILVKVLNSRGEPEPENVCVLHPVGEDEGTHYHFEYLCEVPEGEALKGELPAPPKMTKEERYLEEARKIKAYLDADSKRTQDDAAKEFGFKSRGTVNNRLRLLKPENGDDSAEGNV